MMNLSLAFLFLSIGENRMASARNVLSTTTPACTVSELFDRIDRHHKYTKTFRSDFSLEPCSNHRRTDNEQLYIYISFFSTFNV